MFQRGSPQCCQDAQCRAPIPEREQSCEFRSRLVDNTLMRPLTGSKNTLIANIFLIGDESPAEIVRILIPERALLELSSHVRILFLGKRPDGHFGNLFNIQPTEWARIVLEMYSRRLDALCLYNRLKDGYMSAQSMTTLLKVLI